MFSDNSVLFTPVPLPNSFTCIKETYNERTHVRANSPVTLCKH